uniref:C-type lectin domain-containing protein n=1 Tax=Cyprinodon variegatus TaxID=28743 RepID=A0A3Q2CX09_CYPVA
MGSKMSSNLETKSKQLKIWGGGKMLFPTPGESTSLQGANSSPTTDYYVGLQTTAPFFCYKPVVVRKKKSWEDSWSYCKEHHNMLASVTSVAEMQLIQKELSKVPTTERVWIGLHFFPGDGWLWVDSQPLDYEVWGSGKKPQCPKVNTECLHLVCSCLAVTPSWREISAVLLTSAP